MTSAAAVCESTAPSSPGRTEFPALPACRKDTLLLATGNLFSVDGYVGLVIIVCKTRAFVCEIVNHVK